MKSYIKWWYTENGIENFYENKPTNLMEEKMKTLFDENEIQEITVKKDNKTNAKPQLEGGDVQISRVLANDAKDLNELQKIVLNFDGCPLKHTAKNTVFADGDPTSKIMLIGEAPGANEDLEGIPFCGQSGKLLNNILKSIGYERNGVYVTNAVFWRPPGNRRPTSKEIEICRPFVERIISFVKPKLIVLVGATAVDALLKSSVSMHELRNSYYEYTNEYLDEQINTAVIFHPSYLLRQPYKKKEMWYDMLRLQKLLKELL